MKNPSLNLVTNNEPRLKSYRYDVFKGIVTDGSVIKLRSVGAAILLEGHRTYSLYLNTLLNQTFYLVPGQKRYTAADFVIMSRQKSSKPGKKFIWKPIGEASFVPRSDSPVLSLSWDLFGAQGIFMSLRPISEPAENALTDVLREVAEGR